MSQLIAMFCDIDVWFPKTCNIITTTGSEHANSGCALLLMLHWTSTITVHCS